MAKDTNAFRTISEVAEELKLPQHVLRFWETRFSQIRPLKRGGGRRYYRPEDIDLLRGIRHLLYGQGYTIKGVQKILKDQGVRHVSLIWRDMDDVPVDELQQETAEAPAQVSSEVPAAVAEHQTSAPQQIAETQAPLPSAPAQPVVAQQNAAPIENAEASNTGAAPTQSLEAQAAPQTKAPTSPVAPSVSSPSSEINLPNIVQPVGVKANAPEPEAKRTVLPFKMRASVPESLVAPITEENGKSSKSKRSSKVSGQVLPKDILSDDFESASDENGKKAGFMDRFRPAVEADSSPFDRRKLNDVDQRALQSTLFDLLECKRLLDQVR